MHISASPAWDTGSELSTQLPADLDLTQLARTTKAIQRRRSDGISDGATLLQLCLAHGPGGKSLQETAAWAHLTGVAELCSASLNERLHKSVPFLDAIVKHLLASKRSGPPLLWPGRCLRLVDASTVCQPGSKTTDWRIHATYDLSRGGFVHLEVTDRHGAESLLRCAPVAGAVEIADRGYARSRELRACLASFGTGPRDFIVRTGWNALALRDQQGRAFNLIETLKRIPADGVLREWAVQAVVGPSRAGTGGATKLLPLRLIAVPLPEDKAEINRKKLKRTASRHQDQLDPRSLIAAGFMVLVTSLPTEIPAAEIYAAYRLRWQACPCEGEGRAGVQTAQIPDQDRPIADPHRTGQPVLALCPPHPRTADRRFLPGVPGSFPLRTLLPLAARPHCGGSTRSRLTACASLCLLRSAWMPSARLTYAPTRSSPTPSERDDDRCLLRSDPYPDAYGTAPGHDK